MRKFIVRFRDDLTGGLYYPVEVKVDGYLTSKERKIFEEWYCGGKSAEELGAYFSYGYNLTYYSEVELEVEAEDA